jgi:integrase
MEDMPLPPRLALRGNVYYFRCSIPRDIKDTYPGSEKSHSLRTSDYQLALKKHRQASAEADAQFDEHRRLLQREGRAAVAELNASQIKHIGQVYYQHLLEEDEEVRLSGFEGRDFDEDADTLDALDEATRRDYARGCADAFMLGEAEEVMTWSNVDLKLAADSPSWGKVVRELQAQSIRAAEAKRLRNVGTPVETPTLSTTSNSKPGPLLSNIIDDWEAEKRRSDGAWVESTARANRFWAESFVSMVGDKPVEAYTKGHAREFKNTLLKLPPHWQNRKEVKHLPIREAADAAHTLGLKPMATKNINKALGFLRSLWNWAMANHDEAVTNPFDKLNVKGSSKAREERYPFTADELKAIFGSPLFTGCKSVKYHNTPGPIVPRDQGLYWVPLVGLFTGCRSGEIIQLRVEDIKTEGGVTYIRVTDEGEGLNIKTAASHRRIPVHQTLVDLGFLRFVEDQRKSGKTRLFPEMARAKDGYYSTAYSRKFKNLLEAIGIKHDKISFHSFRHSFEDACRNSRIPGDFMNALQGHAEGGMAGRYGNGAYGLRLLDEEMEKLRYEGLELDHLAPNS